MNMMMNTVHSRDRVDFNPFCWSRQRRLVVLMKRREPCRKGGDSRAVEVVTAAPEGGDSRATKELI